MAKAILEYREAAKIYKTYLLGLRKELGEDGVFHVSINQNGARTGRTSSSAQGGD